MLQQAKTVRDGAAQITSVIAKLVGSSLNSTKKMVVMHINKQYKQLDNRLA